MKKINTYKLVVGFIVSIALIVPGAAVAKIHATTLKGTIEGALCVLNGKKAPPADRGDIAQAILAIGRQDVDPDGLSCPAGIDIIDASSDHLIIDCGEHPLAVGAEVRFQLNYSATVRSRTSHFVTKVLHASRPGSTALPVAAPGAASPGQKNARTIACGCTVRRPTYPRKATRCGRRKRTEKPARTANGCWAQPGRPHAGTKIRAAGRVRQAGRPGRLRGERG